MNHTGEQAFETVIKAHLLANGYVSVGGDGVDRERAIFPETVLALIRGTHPAEGVDQAGVIAPEPVNNIETPTAGGCLTGPGVFAVVMAGRIGIVGSTADSCLDTCGCHDQSD